jgi:hypothetical protein
MRKRHLSSCAHELPVDVAADGYRTPDRLHVGFVDEDLTGLRYEHDEPRSDRGRDVSRGRRRTFSQSFLTSTSVKGLQALRCSIQPSSSSMVVERAPGEDRQV